MRQGADQSTFFRASVVYRYKVTRRQEPTPSSNQALVAQHLFQLLEVNPDGLAGRRNANTVQVKCIRFVASAPRRKSSLSIFGLEGLPPGSEVSIEHHMYHWLCWFKFHITVKQLMEKYRSGDFKAAKQFHKLNLEFDKWRFGLLDPNKLKFKTDLEHFDLMILGIDLGLEALSDEELASCFDELCPCGKEHLGENLRKLRDRVDKEFPLKDSG